MNQHEALNAIGYGLGKIQVERVRQVKVHNWTPDNDDKYTQRELLTYAEYWLSPPQAQDLRDILKHTLQTLWPTGFGDEWFKYDERTPEERLARAGALIAAEIDRLKRLNS